MSGDRLCKGCGQPLVISESERNPRLYCSERCRVWRVTHPDGRLRPSGRTCAWCEGPISDAKPVQARYCQADCRLASEGRLGVARRAALKERSQVAVRTDPTNQEAFT